MCFLTKALSLCDNCFSLICINRPKNHLPTNKQPTNLIYDELESLSSIFRWCNCVKIVVSRKDRLALSLGDNHFDIFLYNSSSQSSTEKLVTH